MRLRAAAPRPGRRAAAGLALALLIACARMGAPPGGPEDKVPPKLLATVPESLGSYPGWDRDVEFRFDEVISEGSTPSQGLGTGDLEKLILLSPSARVPVIHWKRNRITLHPREGWKPDRVYRIELLPGLSDLRRNQLDTTTVITFSTGGPVPQDSLHGIAIDWVAGRAATRALVEMVLEPDSLVYRSLTDSAGRFDVSPLPHGRYLVYATIDKNHDLRRDGRESYDSTEVPAGTAAVSALWLIPRDTVGPRIQQITPDDSVSATISFSEPLDPTQRFDSLPVVFRLQRDSTPVPWHSLLPKAVDDSLQKLARARADSVRAAADTTRRPVPAETPKPPRRAAPGQRPGPRVDPELDSLLKSRPALFDKLVLRVDSALPPDTKFELEIPGIRSVAGVAADARGVLATPKPRPAADSGATRDTTAGAPSPAPPASDSTKPPPPPRRR